MKVADVAARLEVNPTTVYDLISSGQLRCYRIGEGRGTIHITEEQLAEFLHAAKNKPAPAATPSAPPIALPKLKHLRYNRDAKPKGV